MTDRDLNRLQCYIESHHEEKKQLQQLQQLQHPRQKCQFSKNILDIRYEDLRRKVIEAEENKLLSPFPFSQELLIFIQQGMIAWVEEWTKCHPINPINPIDMTDSHKIKESDFIGIDNNADGNNHMDGIRIRGTASSSFHLSISMDLEAQVKNLLTQMAISTILLSASANL
jgi:hypothetical protein